MESNCGFALNWIETRQFSIDAYPQIHTLLSWEQKCWMCLLSETLLQIQKKPRNERFQIFSEFLVLHLSDKNKKNWFIFDTPLVASANTPEYTSFVVQYYWIVKLLSDHNISVVNAHQWRQIERLFSPLFCTSERQTDNQVYHETICKRGMDNFLSNLHRIGFTEQIQTRRLQCVRLFRITTNIGHFKSMLIINLVTNLLFDADHVRWQTTRDFASNRKTLGSISLFFKNNSSTYRFPNIISE